MKVNMDDLLLTGLLDNDDELILLSQVCSGSDVPSFEKGFDLETYTEEQSKASFRFFRKYIQYLHTYTWSHVRRFAFGQIYFGCTCKTIWQRFIELRFCLYLPDLSMETYKENLQVANLFHSQPN